MQESCFMRVSGVKKFFCQQYKKLLEIYCSFEDKNKYSIRTDNIKNLHNASAFQTKSFYKESLFSLCAVPLLAIIM